MGCINRSGFFIPRETRIIMLKTLRCRLGQIVVLTAILSPSLGALDGRAFLAGVDFETNLSRLCTQAQGTEAEREQLLAQDMIYLLLGTVVDRSYLSAEGGEFSGELIITDGEWEGQEEVRVFRAAIVFTGPRFDGLVPPPGRRARTAAARNIPLNTQVLAAARLRGFRDYQGTFIPVLEGIELRLIP
jgi:hypothetical protein